MRPHLALILSGKTGFRGEAEQCVWLSAQEGGQP